MPASPADSTRARVRILSYNIHGCIGIDGLYDAEAVLGVIKESRADLVALQEVYDESEPSRNFLSQLSALSYPYLHYGITLKHKTRGDYGNVLLSRWPLREVEEIDLSIPRCEPRTAIRALVDHPDETIDLTVTHLGLGRAERALQLAKLLAHWEVGKVNLRKTIHVLAGDLNEWLPHSVFLQTLEGYFSKSPLSLTFPTIQPTFGLDRIFIRPQRATLSVAALDNPEARTASDHLPLLAKLSLKKAQPPLI